MQDLRLRPFEKRGKGTWLHTCTHFRSCIRSLFYKLLAVLAVSDVVFILSSGFFTVKQAIEFDLPRGYNVVFPYAIYPVAAISMTGESIVAYLFRLSCHDNCSQVLHTCKTSSWTALRCAIAPRSTVLPAWLAPLAAKWLLDSLNPHVRPEGHWSMDMLQ